MTYRFKLDDRNGAACWERNSLARKNNEADAGDDGADRGARKADKKLDKRFHKLEKAIDQEFAILAKTQGYAREELEELRWDYRYDWAPRFKLSNEDLEYFTGQQGTAPAGAPAPKQKRGRKGREAAAASSQTASAAQSAAPTVYARKSEVDMDLIEKYLDRKIYRNTRNEMAQMYKDAFGEDLVVPERVDLVDLATPARDITDAHRSPKPTKAEIFGLAGDTKVQAAEKAEEPKVEAAPKVKAEPRSIGVLMAWRRGVPDRPTYDQNWSVLNPFRFWFIPKRFAGKNRALYYILFFVNLIFFLAQFVLVFIPFIIRTVLFLIRWVWRRFVKPRVAPALQALKEKAAVPPAQAAEAEKKPAGAKS